MRGQWLVLTLVPSMMLAGTSCSTAQRARTETSLAQALVTDAQSNELGEQVHANLKKSGVRYVDDPTVTGYVDTIGARIFALARKERDGIDYHVHLIDDPKTVNAFATPGGHIYVYSGLVLEAGNEAELAGVMAHETGHEVGRHVERAIVNAYGLQALTAAALGRNPSPALELAAGVAGTGIMRAHSRSEENEADEYGAQFISRLDYDPHAMITFFEKLQTREGSTPRAFRWLSTHPLTRDRIAHLKAYIRQNRLQGSNLGGARHEEIKRRLADGAS